MSHPRVTIHIGQPKTGTSAIQAALAANRRLLAERWKVFYPAVVEHFLGPDPQNHEFVFQRSGGGWRTVQEVCDFFAKACEACAAHDFRHIVVSWEAFFEEDWMDLLAESFARMGITPEFLVYLRRQDAWLESAWKQWHNKVPGDRPISEFAASSPADWYSKLNLWSQRFPKESFLVRPYEKQQLRGGLIADFFISLGYDPSLASDLAPAPETNTTRNSGFSPDVVSMLTLLRELNRDRHDARLFDLLGDLLGDKFKKQEFESYHLLSPSDRIQILQRTDPNNQRIAREYLGRADGRLFLDPWPDPAEPWQPPEALNLEKALPILVSMLLTLRERLIAQEQSLQTFSERQRARNQSLQALRELSDAQGETLRTLQQRFAFQATAIQEMQERMIAQENALIRRRVRQEARRKANDVNAE